MHYSQSFCVYISLNLVHIVLLLLDCLFHDVQLGAQKVTGDFWGRKKKVGIEERRREEDVEGISWQTGIPGENEQMRQRWCLIVGRGVTTQRSISRGRETGRTGVENKRKKLTVRSKEPENSVLLSEDRTLRWCCQCICSKNDVKSYYVELLLAALWLNVCFHYTAELKHNTVQ